MRLTTIVFFVALLSGTAVAAPRNDRAASEPALLRAAETLMAAAEAAGGGDCGKGAKLAATVIDDGKASALPEQLLAAGLQIAATCEAQLGRDADAYRHALAGTALGASDDSIWRLRLGLEFQHHRTDAAIVTVEAMTQGRGAALNAVPIRWLYQFDNELKKAGATAQRRRLLAILAGNGYAPDEPGATVDGFRQRYARLLLDQGDGTVTEALIRQIEHPSVLLDISLDPRFRAFLPADFDLRRSAEQALARTRTLAERHPDRIQPVNDIATYLRLLGKPQESLDALERLRPSIGDASKFEDYGEQLVWWWDSVSRGHQMLGQYVQAADALRKGGDAQENGGLNVSQVINLSELQMTFGHPADTLATLRAFDDSKRDVSPFGTMQIVLNRGCAKALLGKPADAATEVAFAKAHAKDASAALTRLLLCTGDLDGAAAALVTRLDDPDDRAAALKDLSDFDAPPVALPPDPTEEHLGEVKARPEVQAAIFRAGGTRRFHVQRISF